MDCGTWKGWPHCPWLMWGLPKRWASWYRSKRHVLCEFRLLPCSLSCATLGKLSTNLTTCFLIGNIGVTLAPVSSTAVRIQWAQSCWDCVWLILMRGWGMLPSCDHSSDAETSPQDTLGMCKGCTHTCTTNSLPWATLLLYSLSATMYK